MRTPSVKTLSLCFDQPEEAKRILCMSHAELKQHPVAMSRIGQCFYPPAWSDVRMHVLNSIDPGLHGVESVMTEDERECADYLNTGDTYAPTLIWWRGAYRVQSIGDFIETQERNGVRFK